MGGKCSHETCSMDQWQDDCCFSVTNVLLSLSWQSWIEMTLCGLADGRGHDNRSVEPFLFVCVCFVFFVLLVIVKYMLKSWKTMFANIISCSDLTGHCAWIKKQKQNQSETNVPLQQFLCGYWSVWLGCHYNYQTILSKGSVDLEEDANEKATCFWCLFCAK